ncbi:short-subunit dehydrogenase [Micromonospora pisi]|uniref:Short-subunit dehydrogenase n=1 Tax=Micromonospora pisi TaxID=589240 RepID=A0A495JKG8_9ACTN|nr:oxidoreductase [Micromonospora pisi]RKR89078.1 short-subunit dehydrogenase [Micromonospora pisi]
MSVWFITGASRGFGAHLTGEVLSRGHQVVATARNPEVVSAAFPHAGANLLTVALDVTDERQAVEAVRAAVDRFGRIDVLVNNAGSGLLGAVEESSAAEVREQYDINVFGLLAVVRAVVPEMRRQRAGHIVNISSLLGIIGLHGYGVYGSTKFAVEGLTDALHAELAPFGVGVTAVELGYFRTDFIKESSLRHTANPLDAYATGPVEQMRQLTAAFVQPGDPAKAASALVDVVESGRAPVRLPLGRDAIQNIEAKIASLRQDLADWRELAEKTDHDDVQAA